MALKNIQDFCSVHITNIFDRNLHYLCNNIDGYNNHLKDCPNMVELIGSFKQQIKPVFDIDDFNNIDINLFLNDLKLVFPNKKINYAMRQPRQYKNQGMKYSYRVYVDGVRITLKNMKTLITTNEIFKKYENMIDLSIYDKNKVLFLPLTTKKSDDEIHPSLNPIDCSIFECCASYIKEDFEDWDIKFPVPVKQNLIITKDNSSASNDVEEVDDFDKEKTQKYIMKICNHINKKRFDVYDTWIEVMFAIINICDKLKISLKICRQILHDVSELSKNYNEDTVEKWINTNIDKIRDEGYGFNFLINTCIKNDNPDIWKEQYDKPSYSKVKKEFEEHCFKCLNNIIYVDINKGRDEIDNEVFFILKSKDVRDKYSHLVYYDKKYDVKSGKWSITSCDFITKWLIDPNIKMFQSITFSPEGLSENMVKKHYNLFKGYKATLCEVKKNYNIIQPYLNHIKEVLMNDVDYDYNWYIQYLANLVQYPNRKSNVIIIFQGEQGTGKSIIVETFAEKIIGNDYAISTSSPERVFFGSFNSLLCNKVFSVINEAGNELRSCMDKIKDLSVVNNINIEKKGKDPITFVNYNNFTVTTNNLNPFDIDLDDRRFAWFNVNNKYVGNVEYFDKIVDAINHEDFASSLYHYLLEEVEITITNFQKSRPITKEYNNIKMRNLPNVIKFLKSNKKSFKYRKLRGVQEEVYCVDNTSIFTSYKNFCENFKYTAYNKDGFEGYLLKKDTGVSRVRSHSVDKLRFDKIKYEKWLSKFETEDVPEEDEYEEMFQDEDEVED